MTAHQQHNVSDNEIKKFDAFAQDWWDPNGPMKPLHELNPTRIEFIKEHSTLVDKKIIDVGCGGGILSESLALQKASVTAIDMSPKALQVAREHAQAHQLNINYHESTIELFSETHHAQYDIVTCMELLEHVPDPASTIEACSKVVKPGGLLFFSTINRNLEAYFKTIICAEYILNLLPKGTHDYASYIRPSELDCWARQFKLRLAGLKGIGYHPLKRTFYLNNNVKSNYICCFKKP